MRLVDHLPARGPPRGRRPRHPLRGVLGLDGHQGLELYPAQNDALVELVSGSNVILGTPTGSGRAWSRPARLRALAARPPHVYTAPIKALVSEKFFELCDMFGADGRDGHRRCRVNPEAPIICATAEILANKALREGRAADVGLVVMDEFHYYADRDRGWAWQVPLLELPSAQFLLMSATLGDMSRFERTCRGVPVARTAIVATGERPVPLTFYYATTPMHETIDELLAHRPGAGLRRALHPGRSPRAGAGAHQHQRVRRGRRRTRSPR